MRTFHVLLAAALAVTIALAAPEAWAGPGGVFIKAKSGFSIVAMLLAVLLFPLGVYVMIRESRAARRTRNDMNGLARYHPFFAWTEVEARVRRAIGEIYARWSTGDLSPVAGFMTSDYGQSQQDMLDRWRREGKVNVTKLHKLKTVRPLRVSVGEFGGPPAVWIAVTADVSDTLEDARTGKVIEKRMPKGVFDRKVAKRAKDYETVWRFVHVDGAWRLNGIEEGMETLTHATTPNELGPYDVLASARVSPAAASQTVQRRPDAEAEQDDVTVSKHDHR